MKIQPLSRQTSLILWVLSWGIVSFGQPAWSSVAAFLSSIIGFALVFRVLVDQEDWKKRFYLGVTWFMAVQLFQLSWTLSHPFLYIIAPYLLYAFLMGVQFGVIALLVDPEKITHWSRMLAICAFWTLMEWSRTFFLSGFSFNPIGLSMAGNLYTLQAASLLGIYGLSFYVMLMNLVLLKAYLGSFHWKNIAQSVVLIMLPFVFGSWQVKKYRGEMQQGPAINALLVQTSFPVEEDMCFSSHREMLEHVMEEWKQIYRLTNQHKDRPVDLLALPEFVVPFGTYSFIYPYEEIKEIITETYGEEALDQFPPLVLPFASLDGETMKVSNAYLSQGLANLFQCQVVVGLEDAEDINGQRQYFSAAMLFEPLNGEPYRHRRYEKRILVPMGEYIPFSFCRDLAAMYGVFGSFTPGEKVVVWGDEKCRFGVSICYEEMFSDMMRENRAEGAEMLLNITSDAWFPHSKLIRQHFEHARLRTVENGIPLLRACNTGITGCVDALGQDVEVLGDHDSEREDLSEALYVKVPTFHYRTLYSKVGDDLIVAISLLAALLFFRIKSKSS